jgi:hypothetical protein
MVSWLALTYVAECATPLKLTVEVVRNPVPLIVSVCADEPAAREVGDNDETVGTGLLAETVKLTADDEPPPGAGFVTTTGKLPAEARSAVVSEMVS